MSLTAISSYEWPFGQTNTAVLEVILSQAKKCRKIKHFDRSDSALPLKWEREFCLCGDGLAVGEPMEFEGKVAQVVIQHSIVEFDNWLASSGARSILYQPSVVVMNSETGEIEDTFSLAQTEPSVARQMDCSRFDIRTWTTRTSRENYSFPISVGTNNKRDRQLIGDGLEDHGSIPWFYSLYSEAWYYDNIVFPELGIFVPRFARAHQIMGCSISTGKIWHKKGWEDVPTGVADRDNQTVACSGISDFGSNEWTRFLYTPICQYSSTSILVHFEEIDFLMVKPGKDFASSSTFTVRDPDGNASQVTSTVLGRWFNSGSGTPGVNPQQPLVTNPSPPPTNLDNRQGSAGFGAARLAELEGELNSVYSESGDAIGSPEAIDWKHGYMVIDVRTGAITSTAYVSDTDTYNDSDGNPIVITGTGAGQWTRETVTPSASNITAPLQNAFGSDPCYHGQGGSSPDDGESVVPDAIRFCVPQPSSGSFTYYDTIYPAKVEIPDYYGGEFYFSPGQDPDAGPQSSFQPAQASDQGVHCMKERETSAGVSFLEPIWTAALTSFTRPPAWLFFHLASDTLIKYHWFRFYKPKQGLITTKPTLWHSGKIAIHNGECYGFPRGNASPALAPTKTANIGTWSDYELEYHNTVVAEIATMAKFTVSGSSLTVIWSTNLHDEEILGAAPDAVVPSQSGTIPSGLKEPRHGQVISTPFLTDDFVYLVAEDWRDVTASGFDAVGIKRFLLKLRTDTGELEEMYEFVNDAQPPEPNRDSGTLAMGSGWPCDTIMIANCELHGQSPNLRWRIM